MIIMEFFVKGLDPTTNFPNGNSYTVEEVIEVEKLDKGHISPILIPIPI